MCEKVACDKVVDGRVVVFLYDRGGEETDRRRTEGGRAQNQEEYNTIKSNTVQCNVI